MTTNISFMAFSAGRESTEGGEVKRYIGVAPVTVLAVSPNKETLEKLYNTTLDKAPEYVGTQEVDGKSVPNVRVDVIVKTVAEKVNNIDLTTRVTFFLSKARRYNRDKSKFQVIDKYGRTAWVTEAEAANRAIPEYKNGPARLDKDYRPACIGEEDLTNFFKTYLGVPNIDRYIDGKWVTADNPSECEARFENLDKIFTGDFKELNEIVSYQPNNKIKVMFGVRTADDGRQYQTAYTQMFLRNGSSDYSRLDSDLQDRKANGAYPNVEFDANPLHEYKVEATPVEDLPVSTEAPKGWF